MHPRLEEALAQLRSLGRPDQLAGMARFGITPRNRLGASVPGMRRLAKRLGTDHALAEALWQTDIPDARIVASLVADPAQLTRAQMDRWAYDFDSWDVCDQVCQNTFDRSPLAWDRVHAWARAEPAFVRRAAFALLASLAHEDKSATDERFLAALPLIREAASDDRNYVKKGVSWALRGIGKRNAALHDAATALARELKARSELPARWIGSDALRELLSVPVLKRLGLTQD